MQPNDYAKKYKKMQPEIAISQFSAFERHSCVKLKSKIQVSTGISILGLEFVTINAVTLADITMPWCINSIVH